MYVSELEAFVCKSNRKEATERERENTNSQNHVKLGEMNCKEIDTYRKVIKNSDEP